MKRFTQSIKIAFIIAVAILGMPPTSSAEEMGNAEFNRTNTPIESRNYEIILCSSSDSSDSSNDSFDSDSMYEDEPSTSIFNGVDGFSSNTPFNRPSRNPLDERRKALFLYFYLIRVS